MSKVRICIELNYRAYEWIKYLSDKESYTGIAKYISGLLLRHLEHTPGVDLSQSPFTSIQGGSDVKSSESSDERKGNHGQG